MKHTPYMRRAQLVEWLATLGFTFGQVDQLVRDGVIPRKHFETSRHKRLKKKPRAYYIRADVAKALDLQ